MPGPRAIAPPPAGLLLAGLLLAGLPLAGCTASEPAGVGGQVDGPEAPVAPRPPDTGVAAGLDGAPGLRPRDSVHPLAGLKPGAFTVTIEGEPPAYACDGGLVRADLCQEDYRGLAAGLYRGSAPALEACVVQTRDAWMAQRLVVDARGTRPVRRIDDVGLRRELRRRLHLERLETDAPLVVRAGPVEDRGDHLQVELVLEDPLLGPFPGRLLLPALPVQGPGLLMLPGHLSQGGRQLDDLADLRHGRALAAEGHVVLIIGLRAYDAGLSEYQAGLELACAGSSLAAVRMREATVALDLLRALQPAEVVGEKVGVLGHSGGAVWAVLLGALEPVDAVVIDATSRQFLGVERSTDGGSIQVLDETVPALVELFDCLYSVDTAVPLEGLVCDRPPSSTPHLWVHYGYRAQEMPEVRRFLRATLGAVAPPP